MNRACQGARRHAVLVGIRENVAWLTEEGRTLGEAIPAKPTVAPDAKWGMFVIAPTFLTRLVFAGVYPGTITDPGSGPRKASNVRSLS